jgi:hypothetical protein
MYTGARATWYWKWRLSRWSKPWFVIKTFFFLHWNVYKIANHLEDCMNTFGPAKRIDQIGEENYRLYSAIKNTDSSKLIHRMNYTLPGWKWR